jgi:hypothetical protein
VAAAGASFVSRTALARDACLPSVAPGLWGRRADERWTAAYQAVIARCQKGDLLLTTRDAQASSLRPCDFNRPVVHGSPTGEMACVFAGGRGELC